MKLNWMLLKVGMVSHGCWARAAGRNSKARQRDTSTSRKSLCAFGMIGLLLARWITASGLLTNCDCEPYVIPARALIVKRNFARRRRSADPAQAGSAGAALAQAGLAHAALKGGVTAIAYS